MPGDPCPFDHRPELGDECPCVFCEDDRNRREHATIADDEDNRTANEFVEAEAEAEDADEETP